MNHRSIQARVAPFLFLISVGIPFASAQTAADIYLGFGSSHASASGAGLDNLNSTTNPLGPCVPNTGDTNCQATPSLGGLFMSLGGDIMFKEHFGGGFDFMFQPTRQDYGPLKYRESFYDVNGIYAPISKSKWNAQLIGGIGLARTAFAFTQTNCVGVTTCGSQTQPIGNSNHFQVHFGAALQYFVWGNVFVKPEFVYHYVPGLTDQFGSSSVPGAMISVGFGSKRQ